MSAHNVLRCGNSRTGKTGDALSAAARAGDPDVPANALSFSIVSPVGPKVDPASGAISWAPAAPGNFPVVVRVTDNGSPPLSAETRLEVTVEKSGGDLLLECAKRDLVLEDVIVRGRRVELIGVADIRYIGRAVEIAYEATGKVVAKPTVGPDGSFRATAPLPAASSRKGNRARYIARIGGEKSLNLKLARRLVVTDIKVAGRRVTVSGRVLPPLAGKARDRKIEIRRRLSCGKDVVVGTVTPKANGRFTATADAPPNASVAIYRLRTRVRQSSKSARLAETFTLPRIVEFQAR